jgi:hypothetical protein
MTVLVVNVESAGLANYSKYSLPFIQKICEHNNVKLHVLYKDIPQNINKVHPSWLKLFCFDLIDDDFIISWDLDLVPTKLYKFKEFFDLDKFNACYDPSFTKQGFTFNGKFKYNCGLMGIPKKYSNDLKRIYEEKSKQTTYPSYEQYHINDWIFDNKIKVKTLDQNMNSMFDGSELFSDSVLNRHYAWQIKSYEHKEDLIEKHDKKYNHIL